MVNPKVNKGKKCPKALRSIITYINSYNTEVNRTVRFLAFMFSIKLPFAGSHPPFHLSPDITLSGERRKASNVRRGNLYLFASTDDTDPSLPHFTYYELSKRLKLNY